MTRSGRRMKIGKRYSRPGTAPGTLRAPERRVDEVRITVIDYGPEHFEEKTVTRVEEVFRYRDSPTVTWINVEGLHDVAMIESIGRHFGFHSLALEDVLNCGQRPKLEDYGQHHFIIMKSLLPGEPLDTEQISFFLAGNYVITFQEVPGDSFEAVRERIRRGKGLMRNSGADYLVYALIDALVDEFFPVLERYGEQIEALEAELLTNPSRRTIQEVHRVKRELLLLRRTAWPERDVISAMQREESDVIRRETQVFLRDCYDHTIQIIDMIETYRDLAAGMLDIYLSSVSNRMNEIMKVLTIISTIFIPLNFIAGVYGMNFHTDHPMNMPELNWPWGYPYALGLMATVAVLLVIYFQRKGWLKADRRPEVPPPVPAPPPTEPAGGIGDAGGRGGFAGARRASGGKAGEPPP
ncbi:MAG TPA: magnesium/cobalt transporter CorA [Thermoanaerobaculia bacterium]|jgi:magnesium transporter|nr:magnesium/cobalt transporter CorA [Thermoanaerobaculia bacterium]